MSNAFHYQNSFDDPLAQEFQQILSLKSYAGVEAGLLLCGDSITSANMSKTASTAHKENNGIISEAAGEALLIKDVLIAEQAVLRLIHVPLTNGQFDALVSFTFNLGPAALQRSTLRRKINREEHDEVPTQLLRWVWAGGRKLRGLVRRRRAEVKLYNNLITHYIPLVL